MENKEKRKELDYAVIEAVWALRKAMETATGREAVELSREMRAWYLLLYPPKSIKTVAKNHRFVARLSR